MGVICVYLTNQGTADIFMIRIYMPYSYMKNITFHKLLVGYRLEKESSDEIFDKQKINKALEEERVID